MNLKLRYIPLTLLAALTAVAISGCREEAAGDSAQAAGADFLARVGRNSLTRTELRAAMPGGLNPDDSAKYARFYIRQWVDRQLANDLAANELDMTEIDRLVDDYRHELILRQYAARMFESHVDTTFAQDSLHAYYRNNRAELTLQRPIVKGIYLKIPANAPNLPTIRRLYRSTRPADIDRLEKEVLTTAIHYDYFRDNWIDWEQVEKRIPYDFGQSSDAFLRSNHSLDFSDGDFVYLLEISDFMPSGAVMPYEAAESLIRRRLLAKRRRQYEANLRDLVYSRALQSGRLKLNTEL